MGINILKESVPEPEHLQFPATSIEHELGHPVEREQFLTDVLSSLLNRLPQIDTDEFLAAWEDQLAYRNETVQVITGSNEMTSGLLLGLEADGGLRLLSGTGDELTIRYGDVSLRPSA
jgi:biotin-(acetyl-CoA carboxylase) ligase